MYGITKEKKDFLTFGCANEITACIPGHTVQLRYIRTTHTRTIRSYFAYTRMSIRVYAYTRMSIRVYAYVNTCVYVPLLCIPISFFV